jgi:L-fuculose-phosphate aldolase
MTPAADLVRHYRWLRRCGINDSHSGNLSVRRGPQAWITPTGACADTLRTDQLVSGRLEEAPPAGASLDAALHWAVYQQVSSAGAVMHSHGPYTVAVTLDGTDFVPADFEGQLYFPRVPVLTIDHARYLSDSPGQVAAALRDHPIAVVRGHGVYARGDTLALAYKWTCSLEHSAKTAWLAHQAGTLQRP